MIDWSPFIENIATIGIALLAGFIALYQVKSNIIASARIKWIESLRSNLSSLHRSVMDSVIFIINTFRASDRNVQIDYYNKYLLSHAEYTALVNNVKLLLNVEESLHLQLDGLLEELDEMMESSNIKQLKQKDFEKKLLDITIIARKIFKEEWKKSKQIFRL